MPRLLIQLSSFVILHSSLAAQPLNVLFIAVDDLRPELACYGAAHMKTPNIDRLAASGLLFERAYCQVAVCNPSRSSLLSGSRPDTTQVFDNQHFMRPNMPDVISLPQHFKNHGYTSLSLGKIFHHSEREPGDDPQPWSEPSWYHGEPYKHWFTQERKEHATEDGKEALVKALRRQGLPIQSLLNSETLLQIVGEQKLSDANALYTAIGQGQISTTNVIERIKQLRGLTGDPDTEEIALPQTPRGLKGPRRLSQGVLVKGSPDVLTKMARCCTPVPGDEIIGFITRGEGVSVHRGDCKNVKSLNPQRVVEVSWADDSRGVFMVQIQIEALDRSGLLSDVTRVLSENHVNILSAAVSTGRDRVALSRFVFEMADPSHLDHLLNQVRKIEAVYEVSRVKSS
jgi:predicted amino acid-binding ACT domain protein